MTADRTLLLKLVTDATSTKKETEKVSGMLTKFGSVAKTASTWKPARR